MTVKELIDDLQGRIKEGKLRSDSPVLIGDDYSEYGSSAVGVDVATTVEGDTVALIAMSQETVEIESVDDGADPAER